MVILSRNASENMNLFEGMAFSQQYVDALDLISCDPHKKRTYWDSTIKRHLPDFFLDNFTDYLNAGNDAYYVKLQISLRAPILYAIYCKYEKSPTAFQTSEEPFTESQQRVYSAILQFANENNLRIEKYSDLCTMVVNVSPNEHTAYNYLFEPEI